MTETTTIGATTKCQLGSVGGLRLSALLEAKIVDPVTGEILSPGQRGELWLRGPTVMKGNSFLINSTVMRLAQYWYTSHIYTIVGLSFSLFPIP